MSERLVGEDLIAEAERLGYEMSTAYKEFLTTCALPTGAKIIPPDGKEYFPSSGSPLYLLSQAPESRGGEFRLITDRLQVTPTYHICYQKDPNILSGDDIVEKSQAFGYSHPRDGLYLQACQRDAEIDQRVWEVVAYDDARATHFLSSSGRICAARIQPGLAGPADFLRLRRKDLLERARENGYYIDGWSDDYKRMLRSLDVADEVDLVPPGHHNLNGYFYVIYPDKIASKLFPAHLTSTGSLTVTGDSTLLRKAFEEYQRTQREGQKGEDMNECSECEGEAYLQPCKVCGAGYGRRLLKEACEKGYNVAAWAPAFRDAFQRVDPSHLEGWTIVPAGDVEFNGQKEYSFLSWRVPETLEFRPSLNRLTRVNPLGSPWFCRDRVATTELEAEEGAPETEGEEEGAPETEGEEEETRVGGPGKSLFFYAFTVALGWGLGRAIEDKCRLSSGKTNSRHVRLTREDDGIAQEIQSSIRAGSVE